MSFSSPSSPAPFLSPSSLLAFRDGIEVVAFKSIEYMNTSEIAYTIVQLMNQAFVTLCVPKKKILAAWLHSGVLPKVA